MSSSSSSSSSSPQEEQDPLLKVMSDLQSSSTSSTTLPGMTVEIKRPTADGLLQPVAAQDMKLLTTRAQVASSAQLLQHLSSEEKLDWAIETKLEGNALYQEGRYEEAMGRYVQALAATNFHEGGGVGGGGGAGGGGGGGNVDSLVIPVLCNLAACSMRLGQWSKAILFCDQAIALRPFCLKALYRRGKALLEVAAYQEARENFLTLLDWKTTHSSPPPPPPPPPPPATTTTTTLEKEEEEEECTSSLSSSSSSSACMDLTREEWQSLAKLVDRSQQGMRKDRLAKEQMKKSLQRAFEAQALDIYPHDDSHEEVEEEEEVVEEQQEEVVVAGGGGGWVGQVLWLFWWYFCRPFLLLFAAILRVVLMILRTIFKKKSKTKQS
eukprot:scaffold1001_cov188-Ochromonas_danica.AAC.11